MKARLAPLALAAALVACAPTAGPSQPNSPPVSARMMSAGDYVAWLYANEPAWGADEEVRRLFSADLAEAIIKDRGNPDEVGKLNFDFRCGCQDGEIGQVKTTFQDTAFGAQVTAEFLWEGRPARVDYTLERTDRGWLIADARDPRGSLGNDPWSLRQLLGLPRDPG